MAAIELHRYLNDGTPMGNVDYYEGYHEEGLDGTDKLVYKARTNPLKHSRIVWKDGRGKWHEHMVASTEKAHASGKHYIIEVTCENSLNETYGILVEDTLIKGSVAHILGELLKPTRWTIGTVDDFGETFELEVWHKNVRECIAELVDMCGGELYTGIVMSGSTITERHVSIVRERGTETVKRQFSWGRNMGNVKRTVPASEVYTAIIGYGEKTCEIRAKNTDTEAMSDQERAEFEEWLEAERKKDYAERLSVIVTANEAKLDQWGTPGASGMGHTWMVYTDDACTDADFLKEQCKSQLDVYSHPLIRYEFDAYQLDDETWTDVTVGNRVHIIDEAINFESIERISLVRRNLRGLDSCKVMIGTRINPIVQKFKAEEKTVKKRTGNTAVTASRGTVVTRGNYVSPSIGGGGGGDRWTHQIDGITQSYGLINFVTE